MQPDHYERLRSKLHQVLQSLYRRVETPHPAPEKADYGDIDFVVVGPKDGLSYEELKRALGAVFDQEYPGTSNFALPWDDSGNSPEDGKFVQVDVHVCVDDEDWERVVFFHSYGDLGMILGLLARSVGLSMGTNGLRLAKPVPTNPESLFPLSSSFPPILEFFGLSMDRWSKGFLSQRDAFDWAATSPYFRASWMAYTDASQTRQRKAREARGMYQNFLEYATQLAQSQASSGRKPSPLPQTEEVIDAAVHFFGKWELYQSIIDVARINEHLKLVFNGTLVGEWTGLEGLFLKFLMDEVRERLGGEAGVVSPPVGEMPVMNAIAVSALKPWESTAKDMTVDEVRVLVLMVKEQMEAEGIFERKLEAHRAGRRAKEALKASRGSKSSQVCIMDE